MAESLLARGIALFNAGHFFDAHEVLEDAWREERGEARLFLQGLTQAAVGMHHASTGNFVGARSVLARAVRNLEPYGDEYRGIRLAHLRDALLAYRDALGATPITPPPRIEQSSS